MPNIFPQAFAAPSASGSSSGSAVGAVFGIIAIVWYVLWIVQAIMGYGTAYRKTKENGDNGVSLFGWIIVYCSLAACIPGLGIYLWNKSKKPSTHPVQQAAQYPPAQNPPAQYYQSTPTIQDYKDPNSNRQF